MSISLPWSRELQRHDGSLSYLPETEAGKPDTPLELCRYYVKYHFGPCDQYGFIHAVLNTGGVNEEIYTYAHELGVDYETYHQALSWVNWHIGHGDPGCGNFMFWAALTMRANPVTFTDQLVTTLAGRANSLSGKHPELIGQERVGIHYTAANIPEVLRTQQGSATISWEPIGALTFYPLLGTPPTEVHI